MERYLKSLLRQRGYLGLFKRVEDRLGLVGFSEVEREEELRRGEREGSDVVESLKEDEYDEGMEELKELFNK
jgi:hypothetical protein